MASELYVETLKGLTSGANANKVIIPSGQTLYAPGHVIQVVQGQDDQYTATTSGSSAITGITATITPSSTSSKILVVVGINGINTNTSALAGQFELKRNGTSLKSLSTIAGWDGSSNVSADTISATYYDSPSLTSALTYAIYWNIAFGSGTLRYNNYSSGNGTTLSTITLMEIAG